MGKTKKKDEKPKESDADVTHKPTESVIEGKVKKKKNKKNKKQTTPEKATQIKVEAGEAPLGSESVQKKKKDKKKKGSKKEKKTEKIKTEKQPENIKTEIKTENGSSETTTKGTAIKVESDKKVQHDSKPENTIFVGNLPNNTKVKQLNVLFAQFGKVVSVRLRTGQGKKLFKHAIRKKAESLNAYVVFDNIESKEKALKLSGTEYKGRHIRVTAAKDSANEAEPKRIVFVGNLKYSATDEKLYEIFSTCGELEYVRTVCNDKGCTGVAYVCFKKPESVQLALDLNNTILDERPIRVQRYKKNPEKIQGQQKVMSGPVRRMLEKKQKLEKGTKGGKGSKRPDKNKQSKNIKSEDGKPVTPKKEKKSDFHGKKTSADKKKNKAKKKGPSHLQKLAKKIAPK